MPVNRPSLVVASKNAAKINAAFSVAKEFFPEVAAATGVQTNSLVSETPVGDDEALVGCRNRIDEAKSLHPEADFYVSIEGAVNIVEQMMFVFSWVVVEQRCPNRIALGCSAKVRIPDALAQELQRGTSLSQLAKGHYQTHLNVNEVGTNGIVTLGGFTRTDEFTSALRCAFGYLANSANY